MSDPRSCRTCLHCNRKTSLEPCATCVKLPGHSQWVVPSLSGTRTEFVITDEVASPLDVQIGGGHYKDMPIQPLEYMIANAIPFAEGAVIKYVSRWKKKGGIEDLKKARHILEVLIAHEQAT